MSQDPTLPTRQPALRCGTLIIKRTVSIPRSAAEKGGPVLQLFRLGDALPAWLLLIAAIHPETAQLDQKFSTIARSLGIDAPDAGTARGQVTRLLGRLQKLKLIEVLKRGQSRVIQLKSLDGKGATYERPIKGQVNLVELPGTLFSKFWHTQLSPAALAVLLISLAEQSKQWGRRKGAWYKAAELISTEYGLARSSFEKGKAELSTWGILTWQPSAMRAGARLGLYAIDLNVFDKAPEETQPVMKQIMRYVYTTLPSGNVRRMPVYRWKESVVIPGVSP